MCPHNAAKSILAIYFAQQFAKQNPGRAFSFSSAGTDPDEAHAPTVVKYLADNVLLAPKQSPRHVTQQDLDSADHVISMGCDLSAFALPADKLTNWLGLTDASEDIESSASEISSRVKDLLSALE